MADAPAHGSGPRLSAGGLRRAAVVSGEVLLVLLALWAVRAAVAELSFVVVPVGFAILLAAFLQPVVSRLVRIGLPRRLAAALAILLGVVLVGGLLTLVAFTVANQLPRFGDQLGHTVDSARTWLRDGPWHVGDRQLEGLLHRGQTWLTEHQQALVSGTIGLFGTVTELLAGALLAIVTLALTLSGGPRMWSFALRALRPATAGLVDEAARLAFRGVVHYVRTTALIALLDALGIGIGLAVLRVPLALPLAVLVFLGAFVPYVGAFVSGTLSVLVALLGNGWVTALIMLAVVLGVQQLEGQVLQPLLTGTNVRLHPLVVLLGIAVGGTEAGIPGAIFAVPLVAAGHAVVRVLARHHGAAGTVILVAESEEVIPDEVSEALRRAGFATLFADGSGDGLLETLETQGRYGLLGWGEGAGTVLTAAGRHPERVHAVVCRSAYPGLGRNAVRAPVLVLAGGPVAGPASAWFREHLAGLPT
ncbi:AI-2E family transporter [Amycolatopsis jiangsuensis]|uniref:Putative PurR-regulated permease PerM n=1 Tax=Amycolatopsis jiangsuensis TaxID=1181879 RepID=A0A840J6S0_9PSEU|nr:AI-2E family transporter [Amycolatopsis jiangsuensis]MBB4689087.1 putative PurR-regulated permease PerM [Amycolatopsis jiangsuensis]